jgi:hypothetical protein
VKPPCPDLGDLLREAARQARARRPETRRRNVLGKAPEPCRGSFAPPPCSLVFGISGRKALKSERVKYATRTTSRCRHELSEEQALDSFVARIEDIAMTEVTEWRGEFARAADGSQGAAPG